MATEIEKLVVSLEASITKYEKAMARAAGIGDQRAKQIETRLTKTENKLATFGVNAFRGFAAGAIATVASVLSLQAAIEGTKQALQEFGSIADNARSSGLDPETFQELAYQAQQGGVEFDQFSAALETFAKNSGLAVVGKGKMVAALKALNPELLANIQAAKTQEERVRLAADAIAQAGNASERAALSTALFGDAGSKLAGVFEGGSAAIARTAVEARRLGIIVSNDLIARADELGDEFDTATKVLDLQFKQALIELAPFLIGTVQLVGNLTAAVRGLIEAFSAMETKSTATLEGRAAVIKELLASVGTDITTADGQIVPANPMAVSIGGGDPEALKTELAQIEAILSTRKALETLNTPKADAPTNTVADVESRDAAAKAVIKQADAVKKLTADLELERKAMFLTAEQQAALNTVSSAGVDVNSEQGKKLVELALANDQLKDSMERVKDLAGSFASSFLEDLRQGKSATEALENALGKLANKLLDMALDNAISGLVGSLFGSFGIKGGPNLFGAKTLGGSVAYRAAGGPVTAGQPYVVGEKRPELFVPSQSGMILPKLPGGGGGQKVVNNVFNYGNDKVEQRQNSTGGVDTIIGAVERRIKGNMARGQYRQFGVDPGTIRR